MHQRCVGDGIIRIGINQQRRIEYLFHMLRHQRLQIFHRDGLVAGQQFGIMLGKSLVFLFVEDMAAHAGSVGNLTSLMHEAQQVGVGVIPGVRVPDLITA